MRRHMRIRFVQTFSYQHRYLTKRQWRNGFLKALNSMVVCE